ncbi:MAG: TetR/AcrR family transcriptional regulator C-terminal domain-containing protein [Lachnospiraceae bacterium]|nr:TetR/AcrR family transcriptional regulator C-terminal domain-containing protein [Lachnospiraceae bacterium]
MAQFTKKAIITTFIELLNQRSLDKITVKDIVEKCDINHNTFYYYYRDIYDLIEDIMRTEVENVQKQYEGDGSFYDELRQGISLILENKAAFTHLYYSRSKDIIEEYINEISEKFARKFIEKKAEELSIGNDANVRFICNWYRFAISESILKWIQTENASDPDTFIRKIAAVYESTIATALLSI